MSSIHEFIKRNASLILHIFIALVFCTFLGIFFEKYPDYLLFGNLVLLLIGVYFVYRMIFKKIYADSFLKLICILLMIISANHFYSYNKLTSVFPWLASNHKLLIIGLIVSLLTILFVFKLFTYFESSNNHKFTNNNILNESNNSNNLNSSNELNIPQQDLPTIRSEIFSFLRFLSIAIILCLIIFIPALLLYLFNKHDLDKSTLEFDKVLSFLLSYGSSFLLILFAVVITIVTLIYIIKYIYNQIRFFKISNDKESSAIPTYAFSVIIVCILLFLSWRITNFSLNDITETMAIGNYLVLPLAVIIIMVLFFLLVQIVHAVILMLSQVSTTNIKDFLKKQEQKFKIGSRIIEIIESIIDTILNTILAALEFIKFIPNFFVSLSRIVLLEDNEIENQDEDIEDEIANIEKDVTATDD